MWEFHLTNINKPNLIIAGVNKAATTSLFMYLSAHPEICASRVKETQYFLPLRYGAKELPPILQYWEHFSHCGDSRYIIEATAGYFYGGAAVAQAIRDTLGTAKIIILFRDPITRMMSFFKFKKSMLELDKSMTFDEFVNRCEILPRDERMKRENNVYWGIEGGLYANYIDAWFEIIGEEKLKILFFEHLIHDPKSLLIELCSWLDLDHERFIENLDLSIENKTRNYRSRFFQMFALTLNWRGEEFWRAHPRLKHQLRSIYYAINGSAYKDHLSDNARNHLEAIFQPSNRQLAQKLNSKGYQNFPGWLSKEMDLDGVNNSSTQFDVNLTGA